MNPLSMSILLGILAVTTNTGRSILRSVVKSSVYAGCVAKESLIELADKAKVGYEDIVTEIKTDVADAEAEAKAESKTKARTKAKAKGAAQVEPTEPESSYV